jgi:hypothetical protein
MNFEKDGKPRGTACSRLPVGGAGLRVATSDDDTHSRASHSEASTSDAHRESRPYEVHDTL